MRGIHERLIGNGAGQMKVTDTGSQLVLGDHDRAVVVLESAAS